MSEEKEEKVATEAPVDVADAAEGKDKKGEEQTLKPVPRPDDEELKKKIDAINVIIAKYQERLNGIKDQLDSREKGHGDSPEAEAVKARLNEAKGRSRHLQAEKRNIYDQISAADDLKKQQQDLTQRLKSQLTLFSGEQIDKKIAVLEHQQQTTSLNVKEDKRIMEEIKKLRSQKPMIRQYDEANESLKSVRDHHAALYVQLKAKSAELTVAKEAEDKVKAQYDALKAKEDSKKSDVPTLFKERDGLRKQIGEQRDEIKKLRDEFNEKRKEWQAYMKQQKEIKHAEYLARKAEREAEYQEKLRLYEEEEAKRDPWESEKIICEQLISFCEKYLPKEKEAAKEAAKVDHPDGAKVMAKGDFDDPFAALAKKKSKSKLKGPAPTADGAPAPSIKLKHTPDDLAMWAKLELAPPAMSGECVAMHTQLLAKREWLKTAPPKPKKKKEEPKAEEGDKKEKKGKKEGGKKEGGKKEGEANGTAKDEEAKEVAEGDDVDYGEHLKIHMQEALNSVLTTMVDKDDPKKDPFRAMQQVLFQASLSGETPTPKKLDITPAMQTFMDTYHLEVIMDQCTFKLKKRLTVGPKDGVKFLISDAGDFFTEESKKLKAANYVMPAASMTAEELAAKDAADKKAKREKEAKAEAEREEADKLNAERAAALEASGKKATGGLHKFDASEVDAYGGEGTADDFMDAFGF